MKNYRMKNHPLSNKEPTLSLKKGRANLIINPKMQLKKHLFLFIQQLLQKEFLQKLLCAI